MLRILIADDERDSLEGMLGCIQWEEQGYTVVATASDGLMAYEEICDKLPDIVLIDIQMPGLSGLQVIERVRKELEVNMAFVILSGYDDFTYAKRAIQLEVTDYLLKPFRPSDLLASIRMASEKINAVSQGRTGAEDDFFSFYDRQNKAYTAADPNASYPVSLETELVDYIRLGEEAPALEGVERFSSAMAGLPVFVSLYFAMLLYLEVSRLLVWRGHILPVNPFTALSWNEGNYRDNIRAALRKTVNDACSALKSSRDIGRIAASAAAYIRDHYREELSLEKTAQITYTSPAYLSTVFKQELGIGFIDYINKTRIDAAKALLQDTGLLTYEISEQVGYKDSKYFSQVFKKQTKMTPSEYRKASGGGAVRE